jgi:hypothetical protein
MFCFPAVFGQLLLFNRLFSHFEGNTPQSTHQAVSTLLDNSNISEIDHFLCSANESALCIFSGSICTDNDFYSLFSRLDEKYPPKHMMGHT